METVQSVNGIPIRLTSERWLHIVENHDDLAGRFPEALEAVADPDIVLSGTAGEFLALRTRGRHALVVVYRETSRTDGFVITAFQTLKVRQLIKSRKIVWRKHQSRKR